MTLEQLRIFVAVAERQHMTRAAQALNLTQSAVSAGVAALEARYGVLLFDRVGRGLVLSESGRVFLPEARQVLARAAAAAQALDDLAGLRRGQVALGASQTVSNYWLPSRLAQFAEAHPGIKVSLMVGNTSQVAQAVLEGACELGFVEGEVDSHFLTRTRLAGDRIALYGAPTHPLAGVAFEPAALLGARWVLREPGSGTRSEFEHALTARGVDPARLNVVLELPSNEAVLEAAASGEFLTAVSELAAEPLVHARRLAPLAFRLAARAFDLLSHKERRRSHAAAAFVAGL
ncbi:LysR family transcriptional regulator [Phenylobacterium montanum]|uniref:LysR family transcriptional regulator n=1 Tax=Phenylobacterium montanum TaxID=2823693 RepID=A0A975FZ30_9CAUL|nr:LysR family transcriptional regulator [Caulobacter sp. S6]QUD87910.1 LysR family transcriptional regulator [Caulobacter sp. S6]